MASSNGQCILALEDGVYCIGQSIGAKGTKAGEIVFNTAMTGYQEVLTDPSYCGQIVVMTYPHIGNYGINEEDVESGRLHVSGFVVKEASHRFSNVRGQRSLHEYLSESGVIGIEGVDTRALTRRIRIAGAMRAVLSTEIDDPAECVRLAQESPSMVGADLVREVAPQAPLWFTPASSASPREEHQHTLAIATALQTANRRSAAKGPPDASLGRSDTEEFLVVAIDCGMKQNILRHLCARGAKIRVVPPTLCFSEILESKPHGVFVSNGPGDPAAVSYAIETLGELLGKVPIFGICLGHQLLALALGATTFKLKFGHRGANHPVRNVRTGRVEITSQNHGFAVDAASLESAGGIATHINLNDQTLEGFVHKDYPLLAVQYHPEAAPGPHDATYLFDAFVELMRGQAPLAALEACGASRV